jgi:hypothetical protein
MHYLNREEQIMELTLEQIQNITWDEKRQLANDIDTSSKTLDILAKEEDYRIRQGVASNPNTSTDTLGELAKDDRFLVVVRVANNPNTPVDVLNTLATHSSKSIRYNVAINGAATPQVLVTLFNYYRTTGRKQPGSKELVIRYIQINRNCPPYLKAIIQTILGHKE